MFFFVKMGVKIIRGNYKKCDNIGFSIFFRSDKIIFVLVLYLVFGVFGFFINLLWLVFIF